MAKKNSLPKTIVITGAASGIGKHLVGVLVKKGYQIVATDIDEKALSSFVESLNIPTQVFYKKLDVRNYENWQEVFSFAEDKLTNIGYILNNAGVLLSGYIQDVDAKHIDLQIDVNVKGVMFGTHFAAKHMIRYGCGHIINIASLAGVAPIPGVAVYSASKFAVRGFSLSIAGDLRKHGIYVTAVCPDGVRTPMLDREVSHEEAALCFSGPRLLTPIDIERAILDDVIPNHPLECLIPSDKTRGVQAKIVNAFPEVATMLVDFFKKKGIQKQKAY